MKKKILITSSWKDQGNGERFSVLRNYSVVVMDHGGIPFIAAGNQDFDQYAEICDGLIITGGESVHPRYWGTTFKELAHGNDAEETRLIRGTNLARDEYEFGLFRAFEAAGKPIMGICRGHQLVNVAMGGKNLLDFPQTHPVEHMAVAHYIKAVPGSLLYELYGDGDLYVNSFHRDCAFEPGPDAFVAARSEDGIIESVQHKTKPIFAFQFHPERMTGPDRSPKRGIDTGKLFQYFLDIC